MNNLHQYTAIQLAELLNNKEISSLELTNHFLDRISNIDSKINSFITISAELAQENAKKSDERRKNGKILSTFDGIPLAHKDIFCTKNLKTTVGSKMLANFIPSYDASVVEKLNQAGMINLGKANLDEFAMGSSNENSYFGPVKNPWNTDHVAGGSSGGSAAMVAAQLAPITTGTDTGGSVRQPAAFCGVTGIKPTYGTISRYGMIAFASSLDQAGCFAKNAEDLAKILEFLIGIDEKDSTSTSHPDPNFYNKLNNSLKNKKIGLPKSFFNKLNPKINQLIQNAAKKFQDLGAEIIEIDLKNDQLAIATYYLIASAEASSNLSRYDGVRYGFRSENSDNLLNMYLRTRSEGFGEEAKRRILIGTYALSAGYYDAFYQQARRARRAILQDFNLSFKQVDLILTPTTPTTAPKIGLASKQSPSEIFLSDLYTVGVNLAGLPGISFPVGQIDGLPVGGQLIAPHFKEAELLNVVHQYQKENNLIMPTID